MKTFDRSISESIYFKAILPSTTYCISLWGSSHLLSELDDSHIRAARLINNLSPSIPKHEILHKANWNSLFYLYKKRLACIAYQAYYEQTLSAITKLFCKHTTNYNLRDNLKIQLIHSNSKVLQNSFGHRASIVWNYLPTWLKSAESYSSFKANLKKYSKTVDQITFGTNSTATNNNNDVSCIFNIQFFFLFVC